MGEILVGSLLAVAVSLGADPPALRPRPGRRRRARSRWWRWDGAGGTSSRRRRSSRRAGCWCTRCCRARSCWPRACPARCAGRSASSRCGCSASSRTASTSCTGRSSWCSTGSAPASTGSPLFVLRIAVTLAVATASYFVIEKPIRRGWSLPRVPMPAAAGVAVVAVDAGRAWWCPRRPAAAIDPRIQALWEDSDKFQDAALVPADARIGIAFGDSTMLQTGRGLAAWGNETGRHGAALRRGHQRPRVLGVPRWRAPVAWRRRRVARRAATAGPTRSRPRRRAPRAQYGHLDFAVIQTGPWEVTDRRIPGDDRVAGAGRPRVRRLPLPRVRHRRPTCSSSRGSSSCGCSRPTSTSGATRSRRPRTPTPSPTPSAWTGSTRSSGGWRTSARAP